jgi:hypothetical protein
MVRDFAYIGRVIGFTCGGPGRRENGDQDGNLCVLRDEDLARSWEPVCSQGL